MDIGIGIGMTDNGFACRRIAVHMFRQLIYLHMYCLVPATYEYAGSYDDLDDLLHHL